MCGIVGIFSQNQPVNDNLLQKSIRTLTHRGPDSQKIWISPRRNMGLAHTRLSILDLKTGDQPLTNISEKIHLVVNGEFYDFENQRKELEKKGHQFLTRTDSEIALHLYEDLGTQCLHALRGEFAFILWDEKNQLCFAARDRFGIKPLFYSVFNNNLYLASEIKALLAMGIPPVWDEDSMVLFANSTLNLTYQTPFKGIAQIPPGHYLLALQNSIQIFKYWDLDYPPLDEKPILTPEEYVLTLRAKMEEAVRLRLRADVPVGCYLSGGLDSSAVLGLATAQYGKPMPAFTLTFDQAEYDEHAIAKETAEKTGASFHPIAIKQADLAHHFIDAIKHGESFFFNGHGIAKFLLSKAVREAGYKVVLTGEGADELFAGYAHFRIDHLFYDDRLNKEERQKLLANLINSNLVSRGLLIPSNDSYIIPSVQKVLGYTPTWLMVGVQSGIRLASVLADPFKKKVEDWDGFKIILNSLDIENQLKNRHPVNQSLYFWSKFRLPSYILTILGDRMEMAHSVEGRVPFLDHHVAEFMRQVPVDLKIHRMIEKYLLREAARPVLTKTVYERQKHPFLAPPALLDAREPFHDLLQSTLRGSAMDAVPFYDKKKIIQILDRLPQMDRNEWLTWDPILMIILSTCVMQEQFKMSA